MCLITSVCSNRQRYVKTSNDRIDFFFIFFYLLSLIEIESFLLE